MRREGTFGLLAPEVATPLALVLVELVQNAVEHGLDGRGGEVRSRSRVASGPERGDRLTVAVADDGAGLPAGFDPAADGGLGLQIVRTLVEGELGGTLRRRAGPTPAPGSRSTCRCSRRRAEPAGRTTGPRQVGGAPS